MVLGLLVAAIISATPQDLTVPSLSRTLKGALRAGGEPFPQIPKAQSSKLDWTQPILFDSIAMGSKPVEKLGFRGLLESALKRRVEFSSLPKLPLTLRFTGLVEAYAEGGFRIKLSKTTAEIEGDGLSGNRNALQALAKLARVQNGMLALPTGEIVSRPATNWRGVHLFVGPEALEFHKRLWTNVLLPMGFNKVVLQCERTEWESLPNVRGGINMKRADLAKLCDWYRSVGVEPIPLVQSFGHAEWLFQGGANLELAFNPVVPYAVDPRKPSVKPLFEKLWSEVLEVTKARTIHFGLDEVDMRGFPDDPKLTTKLWQIQIPMLAEIAKKNKVEFMFWGDKALAPGEAPDAAFGDDKENAEARRNVIPRGSYVTDWHYKADPNPATFMSNLLLWEREGFQPIAAAWYRPENIQGFYGAATAHGFGTLQTTWAGYESNETNMLKNANQFSAMILAGDYAWSGREDTINMLGYDPMRVFQQLMYGRTQSLRGEGGYSVVFGDQIGLKQLGAIKFLLCSPLKLGSNNEIKIPTNFLARELNFALDTEAKCDDGTLVAEIEVTTSAGIKRMPIHYGYDVRAVGDSLATVRTERSGGLSVLRLSVATKDVKVSEIRIISKSPVAGLRFHGITSLLKKRAGGNHQPLKRSLRN